MRRGKSGRNGLLPNSLRIISSCLKTVSSNAGSVASTVRSAGASVAASIAVPPDDEKDQVLWAGFDKLELNSTSFKNVLLLGYSNGFQVLDVGDASNVRELVSKRDGPVTFLQMQPIPAISEGPEGFRSSHPMLLIVAGDETNGSGVVQGGRLSALIKDNGNEAQPGNCISAPTVVRFFSLRYNGYVHVLRFRSAVYVVRCSPRIVAVALAAQIYCFDATTLENKFSVLTYPVQGAVGEIGYGPMAVGPRWLAYASNNPLTSNTGRLSPQNLSPSPGVSPSTSPGNGSLVARYAMESSKHLAAGIINLGDMGYKTISKYCQDLLPDGSSSPTPSNSGRKVGRIVSSAHASETDNAGMVVVKDFVSKDVVAQFRAHTSPISALCFDPSGTLLVTTSVHGNNINIFRIMPNLIHNGSSSARYDWNTSHVHLYKLYRGLTTAIIQDISFSHYSQWISIISSRGTCHIYVLSPFGGDVGLQTQNLYGDGPVLVPNLSMPWWSASSCKMDHHFFPPPPPTTLSVVSRIKNGNSGWLNTVSSVAASAAGKTLAPSGAIAAVFHNSVCTNYQEIINSKVNSLEHLLVYSPSGHVIQHELLPSSVAESFDSTSRIGPGSHLQLQDEELRVKAEPVQWWDVCRRSNWPERDECMSGIVDKHETSEMIVDASDCEENETKYTSSLTGSFSGKDLVKAQEKTRWYLSNAEVKGTSGRIPIWQKSKICFYTMSLPKYDLISIDGCNGGESEVEKIPVHEVEIRQKDLLPVFQHFHNVQSDWRDRDPGGRCLASSVAEHAKDKSCQDTGIQHSSFASRDGILLNTEGIDSPILHGRFLSVEEPGYRRAAKNPDMMNGLVDKVDASVGNCTAAMSLNITGRIVNQNQESEFYLTNHSHNDDSSIDGQAFNGSSGLSSVGSPVNQGIHLNNGLSSDSSTLSGTLVHSLQNEGKGSQDALEFGLYVQEGYCKLSELDDCQDSTEAVTDADSSSSHCGRDKPEDDADNDEILLGGVFAFSEEG